MPWQKIAATYAMATRGRTWLYSTFACVVARQNGKSELLVPRIRRALKVGERVVHTAQDRSLPREVFERVADLTPRSELRRPIRLANGQERIETWSGGRYKIVAPTRAGARGGSNDLVIIDEARELLTYEFIAASRPSLTTSKHPQTWYLSNAGDVLSIVLNALRAQAIELGDPSLGYLEWSKDPDLDIDDPLGWRQANPSLGRLITWATLRQFRKDYHARPSIFLTEHLCQWVDSMSPKLASDVAWQRSETDQLAAMVRPALGISQTPSRIVAIFAWTQPDGTVALRLAADVHGDPVDVDRVGKQLRQLALKQSTQLVGYNPKTDRDLARHFDWKGAKVQAIGGDLAAAAAGRLVATLEGGRLRWTDAGAVGVDLAAAVRQKRDQGYLAAPAKEDRPIPAVLAAIHAVWLATEPNDLVPKVHGGT